jgi:hypothetical protein
LIGGWQSNTDGLKVTCKNWFFTRLETKVEENFMRMPIAKEEHIKREKKQLTPKMFADTVQQQPQSVAPSRDCGSSQWQCVKEKVHVINVTYIMLN